MFLHSRLCNPLALKNERGHVQRRELLRKVVVKQPFLSHVFHDYSAHIAAPVRFIEELQCSCTGPLQKLKMYPGKTTGGKREEAKR